MKKVFTLLMVLLVATAGFSQVRKESIKDAKMNVATMQQVTGMEDFSFVGSLPNMTRADGELDHTVYDWQSNAGARTWTHVWPDGKINFAFTHAADNGYGDRGTCIGTYNSANDEWIPGGGRIENERTGFGSIAQYGENGLVVAAHTAADCRVYIIPNKDEIAAGTYEKVSVLNNTYEPAWPSVMTSGENRNIIHVVATASSTDNLINPAIKDPIIYFRSQDGGQTWDKENVILPFMNEEYCLDWGSNACHWMETTNSNRLTLVVNNAWSDGMVIYSDDNGETWQRKVFYQHHGIGNDTGEAIFLYPRWVSAQYDTEGMLHIAYEFNGSSGAAGSNGYYPGLGGVAYWDETLPYNAAGNTPSSIPNNLTPGQPFVMDSAYLFSDIYASWWLWSDPTHAMWPEYMGYLAPLDANGNPEDPYAATEFLIEDRSLHGKYNCGVCAFPVLCMVPGAPGEMVVVWSAMDENNKDDAGNHFFKVFANATQDGGRTWLGMKQLTTKFEYAYSEFVYNQAAIVGRNLIVAVQSDGATGTSVMGDDTDATDNLYQGLTFNIDDLWEFNAIEEKPVNNTHMTICPNPVESRMSITLNQDSEVVIYNLTGQVVNRFNGQAGVNNIDVTSLNSGIYFVSAGNATQKFVVK